MYRWRDLFWFPFIIVWLLPFIALAAVAAILAYPFGRHHTFDKLLTLNMGFWCVCRCS